jgi:alkylation response protein AidB-like acyl-CoA dehydrogenase
MDFGFTAENEAFREEVRQFMVEHITPEVQEELPHFRLQGSGPLTKELFVKLGQRGWSQAALRHANQIHAGVAQIVEFDLHLWFRRVASWSVKLGTTFEHRAKIAQALALASSGKIS